MSTQPDQPRGHVPPAQSENDPLAGIKIPCYGDELTIINLRITKSVSTKLNKYIVFTMQTYKKLKSHKIAHICCQTQVNTYSEKMIYFAWMTVYRFGVDPK